MTTVEPIEQAAADLRIRLYPQQGLAFTSPANEILFGGAKGGGKLLDVDTPIPTPMGFSPLWAIEEGDEVFDENGEICQVVAISALDIQEQTYRITFSDGEEITAGARHLWATQTLAERSALARRTEEFRARRRSTRPRRGTGKKPWLAERNRMRAAPTKANPPLWSIKTTEEIAATLYRGNALNHAIPTCGPLNLPERELPLDPYVLGAWLGDGTTSGGSITGIDDEIFRFVEQAGFKVTKLSAKCGATRGTIGLKKKLRAAGVLNRKHVPRAYLRASIQQRLRLLQGLMDTDGTCVADDGGCEFYNTNRDLADGTLELIHSLGIKATIGIGRATLYGKDCGEKYRINFYTSLPAFRLTRKLRLQKRAGFRGSHARRYITAVQAIPPRLKRCIQVNAPSGMFLCGHAMIPTHNSGLIRLASILWCMQAPGLQAALFRRTFRELQDNHMEGTGSYPDILAPLVNKDLVTITAHDINFYNGSHISLNHLQYEKDVYKHSGRQVHVLLFDEATQFLPAQYQHLVYTVMRLGGWKPPAHMAGKFPLAMSGANPGGPAHHFFKNGFVDNGPYVIVKQSKESGGMFRQFIPSRAEDNPALLANDPEYLDRLEGSGDPVLVRALREGDWSIVAGSMFGDVWRRTKHGIDWHVHPGFAIPNWWPLWRGADDGYSDPFAGYWFTKDPKYGTIYVIDELYKNQMLPEEVARRVKERDLKIPLMELRGKDWLPAGYNTTILRGAIDNSAFTDPGESDKKGEKVITRGDQMNRLGCRWESVQKWPGSVVAGIQNFHRLLAPNQKAPWLRDDRGEIMLDHNGKGLHDRPRIVFFQRCVKAIEHIPALPRSKQDPEDIDDVDFDHSFSGVRYGIQFNRGETKLVKVTGI